MPKEILYTSAIDQDGNLVHVNCAEKGKTYYCPLCKKEFILRKSGKTGKGSKRPHFAHNEVTTNCTPEGVLHHSFKRKLIDLLNQTISEKGILIVNWRCRICTKDYKKTSINRNLLAKVVQVREEYHLQVCRPDIALLDVNGNVIAVIEVVVTHAPEEKTISYYRENGITLIQLNIQSEEDLLNVKEKISNPDIVTFCLIPNCPFFDFHKSRRKLAIGSVRCSNCLNTKRTYRLVVDSVFGQMNTNILTEGEIESLVDNKVCIKVEANKVTGVHIPIVECLGCKRLSIRGRRNIRWKT